MAGTGSQRKLLAAVVVGVAVLALPATGTAKRKPSGPRAPHPAAAKVVDRNHDKIFDDLEAKLDAAGPSAKLRAIVTLRAPVSDADVASLKAAAGSFAVSRSLPIIDGFATALTKGQVHTLARNGLVASIARDAPVHAFNADEQGAFGVTKAKLDDPALDGRNWFGPSPANVTVAVIDTGIDAGHQDLAGKVIGWNDLVNGQPTPYDDEGHGTHVSATIAGGAPQQTRLQDGVAPGSRLVGIKVLNSAGSGSTSTIIAGINWMVANKATYNIRVANMSLGASGCSNGVDPLSSAVNNAVAAGIVMVVAAGNDGPEACTIGSPAAAVNAITVGAIGGVADDTNVIATGLNLAYFSSRGPTAANQAKPDLVGPGVAVQSALAGTTNGYTTESGTSMATPFVAGVAALMLDVNPSLTPAQVKSILMGTANDRGAPGQDLEYGAGRVNAYEALRSTGAPLGAAPPVPSDQYITGSLPGTGATQTYYVFANTDALIGGALIIPGWSPSTALPDFDLYLYGPGGQLLTSSEYVLRQEDVDWHVTTPGVYAFQVRSFSGAGAFTLDLQNAQLVPPVPSALPSINGFVGVDRTVSGATSFAGWPTPTVIPTFETCTKQGAGCTAPPYANLWTYQITPGNYGGSLRLHADAFNAVGLYGSDSDPYEVLPEKPFNFTPPTISGTLQVGETLVANPGVWREPPYPATEPVGKGYQWLDCPTGGGACTAIPGAISSTLRLMPSDLGKDIEVVVTGSNRGGSTDVASAQTAVVGPARPSPDRPPTPAPAPPPGDRPTPPTPPSGGTRPVTPLPDMALTMTSNPPPGPIFGVSQITYSVTAANVSDVTAVDAVVTDVLPANLSFVSATVNRSPYACSATGQVVTCPFTSFAGRDSIRIDIVANVNSAVATTNTATVTELQSDANATNNSASVTHT